MADGTDERPPPTPPRTASPRAASTSSQRSSRRGDSPRSDASSSSVFSQPFGTTWRKALVSLPRIVPISLSARYISPGGPRPFVLKLPPTPPNKNSIPVHVFLVLPTDNHGGETMPVPEDDRPSAASAIAAAEDRRGRRFFPSPHRYRRRKGSLEVTKKEKRGSQSPHLSTPDDSGASTPAHPNSHHAATGPKLGTSASMMNLSTAAAAAPPLQQEDVSTVPFDPHRSSGDLHQLHAYHQRSHEEHHQQQQLHEEEERQQKPRPQLPQRPPPDPLPSTNPETAPRWARFNRKTLKLPVLIDFHGGSFILGSPSEQASFCAQMARNLTRATNSGCVVISVDYRLGPYAHFPAANEDAEAVVRAVLQPDNPAGRVLREDIRRHVDAMRRTEWVDLDTSRIAFSGFSSGGNLALNLVLNSLNDPTLGNGRDWPCVVPPNHPSPIPVLLFYPSLDARLLPNERPRPKGLDPPTGFFASLRIESELMPRYLPKALRAHPRASPGLVDVSNGGLHAQARMLLVLPELDSLSEQSQTWVAKVRKDGRGADLEVVDVKGEMHGWTQFPDGWLKSEESRRRKYECFERAEGWLRGWWFGDDGERGRRGGGAGGGGLGKGEEGVGAVGVAQKVVVKEDEATFVRME